MGWGIYIKQKDKDSEECFFNSGFHLNFLSDWNSSVSRKILEKNEFEFIVSDKSVDTDEMSIQKIQN